LEKSWYVIHTYSGFEGQVKARLEERVKSLGFGDRVGQMLIPTEQVVSIKEGKKRMLTKKFFPSYLLVEMSMDDELQNLVKNTPKVTGFLGSATAPVPLTDQEVSALFKQVDEGTTERLEHVQYEKGDTVRIIDGPFLGFSAVVDEVHPVHEKVKVLVSIFGRSTPVELGFPQVERAVQA
jgi:transcriptional antiterminator NusG